MVMGIKAEGKMVRRGGIQNILRWWNQEPAGGCDGESEGRRGMEHES